jgi:hypothetical protein
MFPQSSPPPPQRLNAQGELEWFDPAQGRYVPHNIGYQGLFRASFTKAKLTYDVEFRELSAAGSLWVVMPDGREVLAGAGQAIVLKDGHPVDVIEHDELMRRWVDQPPRGR